MTGTFEHACIAAAHYYGGMREFVFSNDGSTRMVYLIDGVIYKVPLHGFSDTNTAEYDKILNTRAMLPAGIYYPNVSLFDVKGTPVIAMDYIRGTAIYQCCCAMSNDKCDEVCMTDNEIDILVNIVDDPSGMNVIRTKGNDYYIVDVA